MNYYPHHIGDFNSATRHLTRTERSIYRDLIELYYDTEGPLTADMKALCRKVIARTDEEVTAVQQVLTEFFTETEHGWYQERCEKEIEKYHSNIESKSAAGRASAAKRANKTPISQQPLNRGVTDVQQPFNECSTNQNQEPRTVNQEPLKPEVIHTESITHPEYVELADQARVIPIKPGLAGACCKTMMSNGIHGCNPHHPTLLALLEAGATEDEFAYAARNAASKGNAKFAYVLGTVKRQREEAAKLVLHHGRLPNKQEALEESNRAATAGWMPPELRERQHAN
ncbi:YdaU family protein [Nitrosovibrio sp. Nv4]|uniref:YdaU family protein n=1 Tax=Nitrosovibrio sp. Nv4 TaxID=1945880 RepID=UPI000BCA9794|nr:YdaU family protein [Nitrosovibrio sp. Nv4]SOD42400.1 Uncharacterized conserved protein YdaU, DUF1376 family [Nitrosovibrio sp. Nv4]